MDFEKDVIVCSDVQNMNSVKIKQEPCGSKRTITEIKSEPDSDDGLQNQRVPSSCSLMEHTNPDVTTDDCAVEIKEETWWHGSISIDKFQPHLSSLSQNHIKDTLSMRTNNAHLPAIAQRWKKMPKGKNFTEAEKVLLQELIVQYKTIIENKQTDSLTIQRKKATWNRITSEFNARLKNSQKDVTQLKKLWENIKFRRKAEGKSFFQIDCGPQSASTSEKNPYINSCNNITTELNHTVDDESYLMEPQTLMIVEDSLQQSPEDMPVNQSTNIEAEQYDHINGELVSTSKSTSSEELKLRIKKEKFLLQLEQQVGRQRKMEQALNYQLAKVQLEIARHQLYCARNEELFQQEKRRLELEILRKKLSE